MRPRFRPRGTHRPGAASGRQPELWAALLFLAPLVMLVAVFVVVPVLGTLIDSLFLDVSFLERRFVGLENFTRLFADPGFRQALRFTGLFVAVSVPLEIALGLAVALVLNAPCRLRGLLRACALLPWAIPAAVSGRVFELVYNYSFGAANALLTRTGLVEAPVNWLGSDAGAFLAIVAADLWRTTPFAAIILLAGLAVIPQELYRQARIDRAGVWQRFVRITLPLLKPVLLIACVLRVIDALRVFDLVFVLTGGGPGGATTSVALYAFDYFAAADFGFGAAVGVVLFFIALGLSVAVLKAGRVEKGLL